MITSAHERTREDRINTSTYWKIVNPCRKLRLYLMSEPRSPRSIHTHRHTWEKGEERGGRCEISTYPPFRPLPNNTHRQTGHRHVYSCELNAFPRHAHHTQSSAFAARGICASAHTSSRQRGLLGFILLARLLQHVHRQTCRARAWQFCELNCY